MCKVTFLLNFSLLSFYLLFRWAFSDFWMGLSPYYAYAFESFFVLVVAYIYRENIKLKINLKKEMLPLVLSLVGGMSAYLLWTSNRQMPVPFDLQSLEVILLLLILAPVLEELIFHMALWEPIESIIKKPFVVLLLTALLFSFGHYISIWYVPEQFKEFIIYQTIYTLLLGLMAGWRRMIAGSVIAAILVHFAFNLGFFMSSKF